MSVTHISFLFSHMLGVRNKLSDMELSSREVFPELSFYLNDFSKKSRLVRFMLGFNKGFFIPLNVEVVIVRHNFFDLSLGLFFEFNPGITAQFIDLWRCAFFTGVLGNLVQ